MEEVMEEVMVNDVIHSDDDVGYVSDVITNFKGLNYMYNVDNLSGILDISNLSNSGSFNFKRRKRFLV